jgi:uncharacterized membrane protein YeaQ/YmgE (transglycosylase-associated protein family)
MTHIIGWVLIGVAAALGAWIWPFRRGVVGLTVNVVLGVVGAVGAGALGATAGLLRSPMDPLGLPIALAGALTLLVAAHVVWSAAHRPRRPAHLGR